MDREKLLEVVDRLRVSLPRNVMEADQILEKRENIINQALVEARRIRAAAEEEARHRVDENEIMQQAQQQAEETLSRAQQQAQRLVDHATAEARQRRHGADQYSYEALRKLEEELSRLLSTVQRGLETLTIEQEAGSN